ncbi:MAG TPA: radical SAM protein [Candidatus Limnocylindria bacterium]|jgi:MoaA/NifB/PqqE/SkfB family radical SAM enzyme|nr:radical SAM protein [Candidatus Limnocylindria bacterium]
MKQAASILGDIARNRRRQVNLPRYLTYIVTWTCNARCIMCDCWKKDSPNDLRVEEIDAIFAQLPPMDAVRLTGGEPFVRKDFAELADLVRRRLRPRFLHVTTNGFLTSRIVEWCESRDRSLPLRLLVSMDGVGEKHNQVRGRDTAWSTTFATVQAIAPRQKELNLQLSVNQTIVDAEGIGHYKGLRDLLKPLGVQVNVVLAYDASATYSLKLDAGVAPSQIGSFTAFGDLDGAEVGELCDAVAEDIDDFAFADRLAKRYYWRGVKSRLVARDRVPSPNPPCVALNSHLRIFPNGDVPVCQFNAKRVGNLRVDTFENVWFSEPASTQRDWVRKCPGCWAECEVLPNAVYTGDLLRAVV